MARRLALAAFLLVATRALAQQQLDEVTLAQRGNAVLAVSLVRAEPAAGNLDVELPDLETGPEAAIVADNVRALAVIYYASMLEELKLFAVADRVTEAFAKGQLPIGRGAAGSEHESYFKLRDQRFTEKERRALYAAVLGVGSGSSDEPQPNRDFNALWLRFVSSLAALQRQQPAGVPDAGAKSQSPENVRRAGRDLAKNLGLHGYGAARYAAVELQSQIKQIQRLLSNKDVLGAYGAKDMWQVVDRVATQSLGGAQNSRKYRTMASEGAALMLWIARNAPLLESKVDPGDSFTKALSDAQLAPVASAGRWLSASGPGPVPSSAPPRSSARPSVLCLDAKRRLVRCRVRSAKSRNR